MRTIASEEAKRLFDLSVKGGLSLPVLFSTLMRLQTEAYAKGLHEAASPMLAMSKDIDRRMAQLGLDGVDSGELRG